MTVPDQNLSRALASSIMIHLLSLPLGSLVISGKPAVSINVPIELVQTSPVEEIKKLNLPAEPRPRLPAAKIKPQVITAPKLLSKPEILEVPQAPVGNTEEEIKQPEPPAQTPALASLPPLPGSVEGGWNLGSRPDQDEGAAAGAGNLFGRGDVGVVGGESGAGGKGNAGLGRGAKGDGSGGAGVGAGQATAGVARPLGGYQVRPRYPDSARRAGAQGTSVLKLFILENGKVGEILIEQSAGHRDLDSAAADAVRKWLFEPARAGTQAVAVWVSLSVKFQLN